tara:strand:+ start:20243 stop:23746 length:3504 start_codon:yes stop_codon:yes gene_type:complete
MSTTSSGSINISGFILTSTLSGTCAGAILNTQASGGTAPYIVSWSADTGFSATTWDIINLCSGNYLASITDVTGGTGSTLISLSAFTVPQISASLTDSSCILDPNKLGEITVISSETKTLSYKYELRKDGDLVNTHYGTSADTQHTFTGIENGMYSLSVIEDSPLNTTTSPDNTGCTSYDYNDGGVYRGWTINATSLFNKWKKIVPNADSTIFFQAGWGPAPYGGGTRYFETGLGGNGEIYVDDPYCWFYTGATDTRKTNSSNTWYLGATAMTMTEGTNLGPDTINPALNANIGCFYYNTAINKMVINYPTRDSNIAWVTYDPREDYGHEGSPIATETLTGATYGVTTTNVLSTDITINESNVVIAANSILTGSQDKFFCGTGANGTQSIGMVSLCSYNNYTWQTSLSSLSNDTSTMSLILASFRDTYGKYGPTGVTHTLSLQFIPNGSIFVNNNKNQSAYGFNKTPISEFMDCWDDGLSGITNNGCSSISNPNYGYTTVIRNSGTKSPFSGQTQWDNVGAIRVKVIRSGIVGEQFNIQITDTMGTSVTAGKTKGLTDSNPYNPAYDIEFNLLDKSTWSGNTSGAPVWADEYSLCKYLGSKNIGFEETSVPESGWYHMQFSGDPVESVITTPRCGQEDGPSNTIEITATTGTTTNIIKNKPTTKYNSSEPGVPQVSPRVKVSLQTMPEPSVTITGLSSPKDKLTQTKGGQPRLQIYNTADYDRRLCIDGGCWSICDGDPCGYGKNVDFYFGGDNSDIAFGNMYPKFRIYPYLHETDEVATVPVYEAIFDTLPSYLDQGIKSTIFSAQTYLPFNGFDINMSWQYIVRLSYLFKDKNSDVWVDTAQYPPNSQVNNNTDFYMVLLSNPPVPNLKFDNFATPTYSPSLKTERVTISDMPDITASTYSDYTYVYTLQTNSASRPLVTANGVILTPGVSASTSTGPTGDYRYLTTSRACIFFPETVRNGDTLQFVYDAAGGSYTQNLTIPNPVSTSSAETIYSENGYYYINLDKQSVGAVVVSINGITQVNDTDYRKAGDTKMQLLLGTSNYQSGDTISLFYRTIYQVIQFSTTKKPVVPVSYYKGNNLKDEVILRMFDSGGNIIEQLQQINDVEVTGTLLNQFQLNPPAPGNYSYKILIRRYYPLMNGENTITESSTGTVGFEITNDVFHSP